MNLLPVSPWRFFQQLFPALAFDSITHDRTVMARLSVHNRLDIFQMIVSIFTAKGKFWSLHFWNIFNFYLPLTKLLTMPYARLD